VRTSPSSMWSEVRALIQPVAIILLLTTAGPSPTARPHAVTYRFILPDSYVGWVRIDFSVESAGDLDVSADNVATVIVQENGIAQTGSTFVSGARERYQLFYRVNDRLKPVPRSLYTSSFMLGGFSLTQHSASGEPSALSRYFLVGPKSLRNQYPTKPFCNQMPNRPFPEELQSSSRGRFSLPSTLLRSSLLQQSHQVCGRLRRLLDLRQRPPLRPRRSDTVRQYIGIRGDHTQQIAQRV
jgi:hypothetical protein